MASTTKTTEMAEEQQLLSVTIGGLRKVKDNKILKILGPMQCEIELNADAPISEIWTELEGVYTLSYTAINDIFTN